MKSFSSAVSQMVYNLLGYCLSPALTGFVMELTLSRTWGFRTVLVWSGFGAIGIFLACRAAREVAELQPVKNLARKKSIITPDATESQSASPVETATGDVADDFSNFAEGIPAMDLGAAASVAAISSPFQVCAGCRGLAVVAEIVVSSCVAFFMG
jgi:hypothetical protein